jgi:hypothetical protein
MVSYNGYKIISVGGTAGPGLQVETEGGLVKFADESIVFGKKL